MMNLKCKKFVANPETDLTFRNWTGISPRNTYNPLNIKNNLSAGIHKGGFNPQT